VHFTNIPVWFGLLGDIKDGCTYDRCTRLVLDIKWCQFVQNDDVRSLTKQPKLPANNPVTPTYSVFAHCVHGSQRMCQEDPVKLPSGRLEKTTRMSLHHVAQHRPTGSETPPPYPPRCSRFDSEPPYVEDNVNIWRYTLSYMPEMITTTCVFVDASLNQNISTASNA